MFSGLDLDELCRRPDQAQAEADLTAFFGPRAEYYLRRYRKVRDRVAGGGGIGLPLGWNWFALWSWFLWYWYRKLWLEGMAALGLPVLAGWALAHIGNWFGADPDNMEIIGDVLVFAMTILLANGLYLRAAARAEGAARARGLNDEERARFLRRRGGVSWIGAIGGMMAMILLVMLLLLSQMDQINQMIDQAEQMSDQ